MLGTSNKSEQNVLFKTSSGPYVYNNAKKVKLNIYFLIVTNNPFTTVNLPHGVFVRQYDF